jgi:hypothetical protein
VLDTIEDPYRLRFTPLAMGITKVRVEAGGTTKAVDIPLEIDLRQMDPPPDYADLINVALGNLPPDPQTIDPITGDELPMPMGLLLPILDTGGYGFIFSAVDARYNFDDFVSPLATVVPAVDHPVFVDAGLSITRRLVALAGRNTRKGADPPGIVTAIVPPDGPRANMATPEAWLHLPTPLVPAPPAQPAEQDAVGGDLETEIRWGAPSQLTITQQQNLQYIVRLGYLTAPPHNPLFEGYTMGNARSHALWDLYVPGTKTNIELPRVPEDQLGWPRLLRNPVPDDPQATFHYDPQTIEIELNACVLGAAGKPFERDEDFLIEDINLHASHLSQDSYLVRVREAAPGP